MNNNVLIVVDMQIDFIDGALGSSEAVAILPHVVDKVRSFEGKIIFTFDTHDDDYLQSQEGRLLPVPHCIKGHNGWRLPEVLEKLCVEVDGLRFEKPTFGSVKLAQYLVDMHQQTPIDSIEIVGLCTDICVVSNALLIKAHLPEVPICVDASCCAGVTPESHENALKAMESCQVEIVRQ